MRTRRVRNCASRFLVALVVMLAAAEARAELRAGKGDKATARKTPAAEKTVSPSEPDHLESVKKLPLDAIAGKHRDRVIEILRSPLVYRRAQVEVIPCYPDLVEYLVANPDIVGEFWKHLGLEVTDLEPYEDGYICRDGDRSCVKFHVMAQTKDARIIYCIGESKQPPLPGTLAAELVMVQRYRLARRPDGQCFVIQQMEGYASAKGPAVKAIMKLTRSVSNRIVDQCLQEMTIYFSVMSRLMEVRPAWTAATIEKVRAKFPNRDLDKLKGILASMPPAPIESESGPFLLGGRETTPATASGKPQAGPGQTGAWTAIEEVLSPTSRAGEPPLRR